MLERRELAIRAGWSAAMIEERAMVIPAFVGGPGAGELMS